MNTVNTGTNDKNMNYEIIVQIAGSKIRALYKTAFIYAYKDVFLTFIDNSIANDQNRLKYRGKNEEVEAAIEKKTAVKEHYDGTKAYLSDYFGTYDLQAYSKELKFVKKNMQLFKKKHGIAKEDNRKRDVYTGEVKVQDDLFAVVADLINWRNVFYGHVNDEVLKLSRLEFSKQVLFPVMQFLSVLKLSSSDEVRKEAKAVYAWLMELQGVDVAAETKKPEAATEVKKPADKPAPPPQKKSKAPVYPPLAQLGRLTPSSSLVLDRRQQEELISNFKIIIDSTVLKDAEFSEFIRTPDMTRMMRSVGNGNGSRMFMVTRTTRRELRNGYDYYSLLRVEKENEEYIADVEREKRNIKAAFNWLRVAEQNGLIAYYDGEIYHGDETETIQELLSKASGKRVCLFTRNEALVRRIMDLGTENFIAAYLEEGAMALWDLTVKNVSTTEAAPVLHDSNAGGKQVEDRKRPEKRNNEAERPETRNTGAERPERKNAAAERPEKRNNEAERPKKELAASVKNVVDSQGKPYRLTNVIGEGGEGTVYETDDPGQAAKIYHSDKLGKKESKIRSMIAKGIKAEGICWPTEILFDENGAFRGYLMPKVTGCMELGCSVMKIGTPSVAKAYMKNWNRLDLVKVSRTIMLRFKALHQNGILMGDVNPRNIMIDTKDTDRVWFVDCDSYQFDKYRCPVGTPIFTSPRIYREFGDYPNYGTFNRTADDEKYAVTSLLFQILMLGKSPFASSGSGEKNIVSSIKNHIFPYSKITAEKPGSGVYSMIWNNMPFALKNSFEEVFVNEKYLYDTQWIERLDAYIASMEKGHFTDELFPVEYKSTEAGQFSKFVCTECGRVGNMNVEKYDRIVKKAEEMNEKPQLYCSACENFHNHLRRKPAKLRCNRCGRVFQSNRYWEMMQSRYGWKVFCENCKRR